MSASLKIHQETLSEGEVDEKEAFSNLIALRSQLFANGYRVVPVLTRGKKPIGKAWTDHARHQRVDDLTKVDRTCTNTGILCDGLRIVDIDCDDPEVVAKLRSLALATLGPAPVRTRSNSPRSIIVYRASRGCPPKRRVAGKIGGVEILGRGQQFVAFGRHPSGVDYEWIETSPVDFLADSLVPVSDDQIDSFCTALRPMIGAEFALPRKFERRLHELERNDGLTQLGGSLRRKGKTHAEIKEWLLEANDQRCPRQLDDVEVSRVAVSTAKYPVVGPDPLELAWTATSTGGGCFSSRYEKFLSLCRNLQLSRPGLAIALPLERIAELFGNEWTQVRRWRKRAVTKGFLVLKEPAVPHKRAATYVFVECPTKTEYFAEENSTTKNVPLKPTNGLLGHIHNAPSGTVSDSGGDRYVEGWL